MYTVFIRNWWRKDSNGTLVPNSGGRKTYFATANTQDEARAICKEYNDSHAPGKLSRKAEYTSGGI